MRRRGRPREEGEPAEEEELGGRDWAPAFAGVGATALRREGMDSRLRGNRVLQSLLWVEGFGNYDCRWKEGEYPHPNPLPGRERVKREWGARIRRGRF